MTIRRRFFPAQAAQQLPGRTVELSAQLRPEGVMPEPGESPQELQGEGQVVSWLPAIDSNDGSIVNSAKEIEPGRWYFSDDDAGEWTSVEAWFTGQPFATRNEWSRDIGDWTEFPLPAAGPGFVCDRLRAPVSGWAASTLYGVVMGRPVGDITWQMAWDDGPEFTDHGINSTGACRAWASGNLLTVRYDPPNVTNDEWPGARLMARAFGADGQFVGQLDLVWEPW